jgi:hypothetical protein
MISATPTFFLEPGVEQPQLMIVYDAPRNLRRVFFKNGFRPYGSVGSSWCRTIAPASEEARDLEYELRGVGLRVVWGPVLGS